MTSEYCRPGAGTGAKGVAVISRAFPLESPRHASPSNKELGASRGGHDLGGVGAGHDSGISALLTHLPAAQTGAIVTSQAPWGWDPGNAPTLLQVSYLQPL